MKHSATKLDFVFTLRLVNMSLRELANYSHHDKRLGPLKKKSLLCSEDLLKTCFFKISSVSMTLCNFQSCISYQGLQNSANLAEIRFQCVQAQCILQRFWASLADSDS
ncbi:hypothetical protein BpHYR1_038799 [Brachionus plicatilis]|uniref:Uncharacterized protein n=1 Tax=Brachionus plicatilis TaxID=10195 RepID=A0A3M7T5G3_BRAPC|nr:hypothetical protein BpHYR1_038799 [Brachionus plicatilis]